MKRAEERAEKAARLIIDKDPLRYVEYLENDSSYKELNRIKKTSSFQLFTENFGVGWWGVIALAIVFLINILIALIKLPTLPHSNLKHARWLSVPFFVLLTLWMFQSVWLSFAIGIMLTGILDWHSIKTKGLNRIIIILVIYSIGFFFFFCLLRPKYSTKVGFGKLSS